MTEKSTHKKLDKQGDDALTLTQRQTILNRMYGHKQALAGLLAETNRIIEWLQKQRTV